MANKRERDKRQAKSEQENWLVVQMVVADEVNGAIDKHGAEP